MGDVIYLFITYHAILEVIEMRVDNGYKIVLSFVLCIIYPLFMCDIHLICNVSLSTPYIYVISDERYDRMAYIMYEKGRKKKP